MTENAEEGHIVGGFLLMVLILLMSCHGKVETTLKSMQPIVLEANGVEIHQYWEFENDPVLWDTNYMQPTSIRLYRDSLTNILGKDTLESILQQRAFQSYSFKSVENNDGDSINARLVHSKTVGKIRTMNNLEAQLLDYQISRYPLLSHPTEFHGFILFHDSRSLIRVYIAASDQPWPPKPRVILEAIKKDLSQGWTLRYHLHNHYEPKSNHYLGILAPSMTDAQYYMFLSEDYNLEASLITNGIHTVEIERREFWRLKSPDNN